MEHPIFITLLFYNKSKDHGGSVDADLAWNPRLVTCSAIWSTGCLHSLFGTLPQFFFFFFLLADRWRHFTFACVLSAQIWRFACFCLFDHPLPKREINQGKLHLCYWTFGIVASVVPPRNILAADTIFCQCRRNFESKREESRDKRSLIETAGTIFLLVVPKKWVCMWLKSAERPYIHSRYRKLCRNQTQVGFRHVCICCLQW